MSKEYIINKALLDRNIYSRPGSKMKAIKGICIHWVANANTSAINNRNYFNNLPTANKAAISKGKKARYASSHEIIGLNGEVVMCVPSNEVAFHAGARSYKQRARQLLNNSPNRHLYGIEVCHPDWNGRFSDITYKTLINRCADLLIEFDLKPSKNTIWRHFDVTGKDCPRYYVKNNREWDILVSDITMRYNEKVNKKIEEVITMELKKWQKEMGEEALTNLVKKGIVNNPQNWNKSLGEPTPQYLFWSIIDRITKENK